MKPELMLISDSVVAGSKSLAYSLQLALAKIVSRVGGDSVVQRSGLADDSGSEAVCLVNYNEIDTRKGSVRLQFLL